MSDFDNPCQIKDIPLICIDIFPDPKLNVWKSLAVRNVVMATRKRDFHVRYFKGAKDNGSKCGLFIKSRMRGSSHSGSNLVVGGLE